MRRPRQGRRDHGHVQQDGGEGRHGEAAEGIQGRPRHGHQGDEEQVGEGDPHQIGGQGHLLRLASPARAEDRYQHRCPHHAQEGHTGKNRQQKPAHRRQQLAQLRGRALIPVLGEHRNEGGREGALAEQPAEEVGQPEGDEEGVGGHAGAKHPGQDHVPDEAQDPGDQGHAPDGGG